MADGDEAPSSAVAAAKPDAQATVSDFLDYTDFFPSDLQRSLTLIGHVDAACRAAVQHVHELTALYGSLPARREPARPTPPALRRRIAQHLRQAVDAREHAYAEAARLHEVAVRHAQRAAVIAAKLRAQPEPPSRDPTPPPVSPTALAHAHALALAHRPPHRSYERPPHLRLTWDSARHGAAPARRRPKKTAASVPRARARRHSVSSPGDPSAIHIAASPRRRRDRDRDRPPPAARPRPPGVLGTNVHSAIAGISTSNALAQLAPPPPDARPGSKWAPWGKLTEYEMAVLRKQMKKNAVWTPSMTMVTRELERKHRTLADYDHERARCAAAGEALLDEEPETLQQIMTASGLGQLAPHGPAADLPPPSYGAAEPIHDAVDETGPVSIRLKPVEPREGRKVDRFSQRQQALRDAQELVDATEKIKEAANGLKELTFGAHAAAGPGPTNKRKRDASSPFVDEHDEADATEQANDDGDDDDAETYRETGAADEDDEDARRTKEASVATQDSTAHPPKPKRVKLQCNVAEKQLDTITSPESAASAPATPKHCHASIVPSIANMTPRPLSEALATPAVASATPEIANEPPETDTASLQPAQIHVPTSSVQIPLAPAGPTTPKTSKPVTKQPSRQPTPSAASSAVAPQCSPIPPVPAPEPAATPTPAATAASSRPRRSSTATVRVPTSPDAAPPPRKALKASTPAAEPASRPIAEAAAPVLRPRSARSHVPTPKAQSEEPKPNELGRVMRETRRHSIFSQSAIPENSQATRMSSRRKPPPKGEVTAAEHGKKTVTNVKRAQGSKNKKKKKTEEEMEQVDAIDPDEPKYCICDDVSYGAMISCDNNVSVCLVTVSLGY